jgi:hypothetical protein
MLSRGHNKLVVRPPRTFWNQCFLGEHLWRSSKVVLALIRPVRLGSFRFLANLNCSFPFLISPQVF